MNNLRLVRVKDELGYFRGWEQSDSQISILKRRYYRMTENYLSHHGIKGQQWGIRNGPPYPLDVEGQLENIKSLNSELNKWKYGVVIDGNVITDSSKIDWSKYKTIPIDDMKKYKAGICWDFVNYQHDIFKSNGYPDESYMFIVARNNNPNDIATHTFSTVDIGDKTYWFESSWSEHKGIHEVTSYKDVINALRKEYGADNAFDVYKYNPDGLDKNLTDSEFFEKTTNDLVDHYNGKKTLKHSDFLSYNRWQRTQIRI